MRTLSAVSLVLLATALACGGGSDDAKPVEAPPAPKAAETTPSADKGTAEAGEAVWTCPMHPEVRQDHPGSCPKCGMDLVKAEPSAEPSDEAAGEDAAGTEPSGDAAARPVRRGGKLKGGKLKGAKLRNAR